VTIEEIDRIISQGEGDQRIDLRDKIFREIIGNIIVHREYTDAMATELIIEEDAVRTLNPNNPYFNGIMDLNHFNPHPKNPNIRKFFTALGWADEIGSGIRNTRNYLPHYVENAEPVFIDEPLFRTVIPLVRHTMSDFTSEWFGWLELDEKWRPKLTESLKNIEIDGQLHNMDWEGQITCLASSWMEKVTKLVPSASKNSTKLQRKYISDNQDYKNNQVLSSSETGTKLSLSPLEKLTKFNKNKSADNHHNNINEPLSPNEKLTKSDEEKRLSSIEKVTKLPSKRLQYYIIILLLSSNSISIDDLIEIFSFKDRSFFRRSYLKPLCSLGFIQRTNPNKPTSPNQKYLITEQGKRFLTGKND
jgi:ATP-dependent DNA helicase RecG